MLARGFRPREFGCPDGGKYDLSADGVTGTCSHHGHAAMLTPCCEIPLEKVSEDEAEFYEEFLNGYNEYRARPRSNRHPRQITPQRYRLETIVLPLIDNSIYTGLALS